MYILFKKNLDPIIIIIIREGGEYYMQIMTIICYYVEISDTKSEKSC